MSILMSFNIYRYHNIGPVYSWGNASFHQLGHGSGNTTNTITTTTITSITLERKL